MVHRPVIPSRRAGAEIAVWDELRAEGSPDVGGAWVSRGGDLVCASEGGVSLGEGWRGGGDARLLVEMDVVIVEDVP